MRRIIRKINRREKLTDTEYSELMQYIESLKLTSPPSYHLFYEKYAGLLYADYNTLISKYAWDMDELINYLTLNPDLFSAANISITAFPIVAHPYLYDIFNATTINIPAFWRDILLLHENSELPKPRTDNIIIKYEEANPYKEKGLKYHFERLANYAFINRIQSYRYLTGGKANLDRFDVIAPDCLGGIFTNKEKSIYYYLFLTEANIDKAKNAAKLLNQAFYNRSDGE